LKGGIDLRAFVFRRQIVEGGHQRLRDEHAAVGTEVAVRVGEM
jgi:hypothetical protein